MEYMMIVCGTPSESVDAGLAAETTAWVQEMTTRAVRKLGSPLRPATSATTLRHGGERVQIEPGRMVRVGAGTNRKLEPGPDGVRIVAIGCAPGKPYQRPEGLRLPARS